MVETDEGSPVIMDQIFTLEEEGKDVFIDVEAFLRVVGPPPGSAQLGSRVEDIPFVDGLKDSSTIQGDRTFGDASHAESSCCEFTGFKMSDLSREYIDPYPFSSDDGLFFPYSSAVNSFCYDDGIVGEVKNPTTPFENLVRNKAGQSEPKCEISGANSYEFPGFNVSDLSREYVDPHLFSSDDGPYFPYSSAVNSFGYDDGIIGEEKYPTTPFEDLIRNKAGQSKPKCEISGASPIESGIGTTEYSCMPAVGNEFKKPSSTTLSNDYSEIQVRIQGKKNIPSITSNDIISRASEVVNDVTGRKYYGAPCELSATEGIRWPSSTSLSLIPSKKNGPCVKDEKEETVFESRRTFHSVSMTGETPVENSAVVAHESGPVLQFPGQPAKLPLPPVKAENDSLKMENDVPEKNSYPSKITYQGVQNNMTRQSNVDCDSDVCILEDMSAPACPSRIATNTKSIVASQSFTARDTGNQIVAAHSRHKSNDERVIFRVALQDLSQPKSEATPPDGVLSVPLLKHQRIALSWMVNKETRSACCSGGILADDQGLGKTISTIALILKERSPPSKTPKTNERQTETETLNLDEDDDGALETYHQGAEPCQVNGSPTNGAKASVQAKGRPSGGTLIVCPTSVLRQWSEELHNKVTSEADLSVLVYYGSNRTKDPLELAKYDVVVTTYAIVSMEVPKQPVVDENDDQIGSPVKEFSSCRKRKLLETMPDKKSCESKKTRKGINNELLENMSGPLAKVGWFRVVLDEAQSIKNHRTQVARACWGLRAKRRWCLSGTPIQNAIDDLYSYFRFLRHEPYAVFRTFCEQLKVPIHRSPKNGYKKLQAVLKTIMLRRTKGTLIDGEPIINLPPKTIQLKKVDFSKEERDFYCRLEAESRAQFAEYAAAGTVKQNYVNILLMLLRLRQACDHPLLVKGFSSNSKMTSSIEMAKKLSREKQISLLNCLEASLAICGICSDPPEDAVVTVCGHVFCNQCICEHIIGDDTQCPTKKCKTSLTMSSVFSTTTLRIALADKLNEANAANSEVAEVSELRLLRSPEDSSKIKAALDLLLSLSKPQDCAPRINGSELIHGGCSVKLRVCDSGEDRTLDMNRDSNNLVKVMGEKAIVFSQWTGMLDLLEACLKKSSIQYRRLDGTMPVAARDRAVKDFNSLPQVSVMIMSLKAASLGLNMVAACNVILLDLWWNPTTEDQAIDRAHRIGQKRPVSVFRLTVKDTVEDRILLLQQRKRKMVSSAFGEDETGSRQTRLTVEDLKYLFRVD
ncbi:UNVERIFIED_CONTAM: Helicase-like transcription factor CHR28 [Sesamum radiatum]|uniref:Helicase-like transcription factor CHR28 n=1 Tax=Sesamum radiatum TaxID=300843 RepID=A0AAW2LPJ8_SESRA